MHTNIEPKQEPGVGLFSPPLRSTSTFSGQGQSQAHLQGQHQHQNTEPELADVKTISPLNSLASII